MALTLGIALGAYESEGARDTDGNALGVSLILGIFEIEGAALTLGFNEADGPLLILDGGTLE